MMTILTGNHGNQILRELLLKFSGKFINYSGSISDRLVQHRRLNKDLVDDWYFKCQERGPRKQTLRAISSSRLVTKTSSAFNPHLRVFSYTLRRTAKSCDPASVLKLPEIFCLSFKGRISRSARLLVAGTSGLWRHCRVASQ